MTGAAIIRELQALQDAGLSLREIPMPAMGLLRANTIIHVWGPDGVFAPLDAAIAADPVLAPHIGGCIVTAGAQVQVMVDQLRDWMVHRVLVHGHPPTELVAELLQTFRAPDADLLFVSLLAGPCTPSRIALTENADLIPLSMLPPGTTAVRLQEHGAMMAAGWSPPTSAIVARHRAPAFTRAMDGDLMMALHDAMTTRLDELRRACACAFDGRMSEFGRFAHHPILSGFIGSGLHSQLSSRGRRFAAPVEIMDPSAFAAKVNAYLAMPEEQRIRLTVPIDRLGRADLGIESVDRAIDLGIAIEALLVTDNEGNERLGAAIGLRGAWLLHGGGTASDRKQTHDQLKRLYDFRSKAVHRGRLTEKAGKKARDMSATDAEAVLDAGVTLVRNLLRTIVQRGGVSDEELRNLPLGR